MLEKMNYNRPFLDCCFRRSGCGPSSDVCCDSVRGCLQEASLPSLPELQVQAAAQAGPALAMQPPGQPLHQLHILPRQARNHRQLLLHLRPDQLLHEGEQVLHANQLLATCALYNSKSPNNNVQNQIHNLRSLEFSSRRSHPTPASCTGTRLTSGGAG